jgi:cell envelope opacity-associated protein A
MANQVFSFWSSQTLQHELAERRSRAPGRVELGPGTEQNQQAAGLLAADPLIQPSQRRGVGPVQILDHQHERRSDNDQPKGLMEQLDRALPLPLRG